MRMFEPKVRAVMLLDSLDRDLVIDAFRGGARGVFCRGYSFNAFPKCIRQVHKGQVWVSNLELEFLLELVISLRPLKVENRGGIGARQPEFLIPQGMASSLPRSPMARRRTV